MQDMRLVYLDKAALNNASQECYKGSVQLTQAFAETSEQLGGGVAADSKTARMAAPYKFPLERRSGYSLFDLLMEGH
jgi:hypothetical protein